MQTNEAKSKGKKKPIVYNPDGKFPKTLWFDLSKKAKWEKMAKKQGKTKQGQTLAAFIQRNVGRFTELEQLVRGAHKEAKDELSSFPVSAKDSIEYLLARRTVHIYLKVLAFIEALKTE